jgi:endo-1,3-1,4-beta-glycanase ExoK
MLKKPFAVALLIVLGTTLSNARPARDFQFWKFGYQWTTDSGQAPGPGSFSPSHVSPLTSGIGLTLTETSTGTIVGGEVRTLDRFLYGTFKWTEYVPVQVSGQISAGFLYYDQSTTEIDVEQEGDLSNTFWVTNWVGTSHKQSSMICCYAPTAPHVMKLVWKPGVIDYYIDGALVAIHMQDVPSTAAYFIFNFWGTDSTAWGGLATPGTRNYIVSGFSYSPTY